MLKNGSWILHIPSEIFPCSWYLKHLYAVCAKPIPRNRFCTDQQTGPLKETLSQKIRAFVFWWENATPIRHCKNSQTSQVFWDIVAINIHCCSLGISNCRFDGQIHHWMITAKPPVDSPKESELSDGLDKWISAEFWGIRYKPLFWPTSNLSSCQTTIEYFLVVDVYCYLKPHF